MIHPKYMLYQFGTVLITLRAILTFARLRHDLSTGTAKISGLAISCTSTSDVPIVYHHFSLPLSASYIRTPHTQILMGYRWILILLLTIAAFSPSTALTPSTSVPLHQNQHLLMSPLKVKANCSVPYLLTPPPALSTTAMIRAVTGSHCSAVEVEPVQGLGTTIEIGVNGEQIAGTAWMTEFMSFSWDSQKETLFALFDNGFLLVATDFSITHRSIPQEKMLHRGSPSATDTWFTEHHQLLQLHDQLFVFFDDQVEKVTLHQEHWSSEPFALGVITAKVQGGKLVLVTQNTVSAYSDGTRREIRTDGVRFQDYEEVGQFTYLLDLSRGLIEVSKEGEIVWQIEALEYAVAVRGIGSTVMVLYQYQHRTFLAEFFREKQLTLNRYYHSQPNIRDFKLGPRLAILDCVNQFVVFHHSINRHSFEMLSVTDRLFVSRGQGISQVEILNQGYSSSFLIASKNKIQHLTLAGLGTKDSLHTLTLSCSSNDTISEAVLAKFDGPCSDPNLPPHQYTCSVDFPVEVEFEYQHVRKADQNKHTKFIAWLSILLVVAVSSIVCVSCRRKLLAIQAKCKSDYDELVRKRKERTQQMESTFNKDVSQ